MAEENGAIIGFAIARGEALLDIAVAVARRGVGRALVQALSRGRTKITLEVSERNSSALSFYPVLGFRVVGRRPKFYNDGADAVLMDLELP